MIDYSPAVPMVKWNELKSLHCRFIGRAYCHWPPERAARFAVNIIDRQDNQIKLFIFNERIAQLIARQVVERTSSENHCHQCNATYPNYPFCPECGEKLFVDEQYTDPGGREAFDLIFSKTLVGLQVTKGNNSDIDSQQIDELKSKMVNLKSWHDWMDKTCL